MLKSHENNKCAVLVGHYVEVIFLPNNYEIDVLKYQSSISKEFLVFKDRVRSLIGNRHWGEEGRYKEIILINFLRKHIPKNMSVGTGFIMNGNEYSKMSSQIDIIIYDESFPVIFKENDFVIVHANSVLGIIEVKSQFYKNTFEEVIKKAKDNALLIPPDRRIFNGIFFYDCNERDFYNDESFCVSLRDISGKVNHICFGENFFLKYWTGEYKLYKINNLSFSYFLSNLIERAYRLCNNYMSLEYLKWFLYPIEESKEAHLIKTFEMPLTKMDEKFRESKRLLK